MPGKSLGARLITALSSPRTTQKALSLWLAAISLWLLPLVFLSPRGEAVLHVAEGNPGFAAIYAVILTATVICMLKRFKAVIRRASVEPRLQGKLSNAPVVVDAAFDPERARRALRAAGYHRIAVTEDRAWGVRNAISPLGTLVLHASFLLIVAGGLVSLLPGVDFVGRTRLTQGEPFSGNAGEYFEIGHGSAPVEQRPGPAFTVKGIEGSAVGDTPPVSLTAVLTASRGSDRVVSAGLPWIPDPATTVAVEDFGMTPALSIIPSGAVNPSARIMPKLQLARSGTEEYVETPVTLTTRYRVGLRMVRGADSAPPRRPRVVVSVARGQPDGSWRLEAEPATLSVGDSHKFGSVTVRLDWVAPNAVFRVSRSPATPFIGLAVLFAVVGPALRLLFPRREALVAAEGDAVSLSVSVDAYRPSPSVLTRLVRSWERAGG